jgi:hypothetical protein
MYCIKHIISVVGVITLYCKAQYVLYQHFGIIKNHMYSIYPIQVFSSLKILHFNI